MSSSSGSSIIPLCCRIRRRKNGNVFPRPLPSQVEESTLETFEKNLLIQKRLIKRRNTSSHLSSLEKESAGSSIPDQVEEIHQTIESNSEPTFKGILTKTFSPKESLEQIEMERSENNVLDESETPYPGDHRHVTPHFEVDVSCDDWLPTISNQTSQIRNRLENTDWSDNTNDSIVVIKDHESDESEFNSMEVNATSVNLSSTINGSIERPQVNVPSINWLIKIYNSIIMDTKEEHKSSHRNRFINESDSELSNSSLVYGKRRPETSSLEMNASPQMSTISFTDDSNRSPTSKRTKYTDPNVSPFEWTSSSEVDVPSIKWLSPIDQNCSVEHQFDNMKSMEAEPVLPSNRMPSIMNHSAQFKQNSQPAQISFNWRPAVNTQNVGQSATKPGTTVNASSFWLSSNQNFAQETNHNFAQEMNHNFGQETNHNFAGKLATKPGTTVNSPSYWLSNNQNFAHERNQSEDESSQVNIYTDQSRSEDDSITQQDLIRTSEQRSFQLLTPMSPDNSSTEINNPTTTQPTKETDSSFSPIPESEVISPG